MIGNSRAPQRKNNTWPLQKTTNNSALIGCLIYDVEKRWGSVSTLLPALYYIIIYKNIYKRYTERKNWIIISLLSFPWRGWESSILTFPRSQGEWVCININANELSRVDALAHTQVFFYSPVTHTQGGKSGCHDWSGATPAPHPLLYSVYSRPLITQEKEGKKTKKFRPSSLEAAGQ